MYHKTIKDKGVSLMNDKPRSIHKDLMVTITYVQPINKPTLNLALIKQRGIFSSPPLIYDISPPISYS